jgi:replicative DNA helicase
MKEAIGWLDKGEPKRAQDVLLKDTIELSSFGREVKIIDFVTDFKGRKELLTKRRDNPEILKQICIPTGIEKLDYELDGGLRKGELGIFLAPPEGGKSISLQDISISGLLQGFKVALVTIEMTPEQTAYRLDSNLTQIRYRQFRRAKLTDEEISQWESYIKKLKENSLKIIGVPEGCSCRLIESELSRISGLFQPDMVVIDYAGIMSPNEGSYSNSMDWRYVGAIVRNIKGLALKLNVPVWSAAQLLVQAKEKAELSFGDVGLARQQIAAHSDICIAIIQTSQMRAMDQTKLQFIKIREGCENRFLDIVSDYDRIKLSREENNSANTL